MNDHFAGDHHRETTSFLPTSARLATIVGLEAVASAPAWHRTDRPSSVCSGPKPWGVACSSL